MLQMNPDDLVRLRQTFDQQADAVESLRSTINAALGGTIWESPAANNFRDLWNGEFTPSLQKLRDALQQAAMAVQNSHDKVVEANSAL